MSALRLHNTLSGGRETFAPIDAGHVRVYACGPTVYDRIHVGNARPIVVFDVLVRLLRHLHPKVSYVRNITDIDDKIIERAKKRGMDITALCDETIDLFHEDCARLGAAPPDHEPRATLFVEQMAEMIAQLIERGCAYVEQDHVLFSVSSMPDYGALSKRSRDDMIAGARVEVAPYKRDPADFVLWKPSLADQPGWKSPFINGPGRPGWHIECSAMARHHLGETFDIHAGGVDLVFPHHENEIAQSRCAHGTDIMAKYWVHNGFVTTGATKMSKSLGNMIPAHEAIARHGGETVRLALLATHYRAPVEFTDTALASARRNLDKMQRAARGASADAAKVDPEFLDVLCNDLNTPGAIAYLHRLASKAGDGDDKAAVALRSSAAVLGLLQMSFDEWMHDGRKGAGESAGEGEGGDAGENSGAGKGGGIGEAEIDACIEERQAARKNRDFAEADRIRDALAKRGVVLEDDPDGSTSWRRA